MAQALRDIREILSKSEKPWAVEIRAKIDEPASEYIWENLAASEVREGTVAGFSGMSRAFEEYAIAGTLHLDHLAGIARSALHRPHVRRVARETAAALGSSMEDGERHLNNLLDRHRAEWLDFLVSLGRRSFVGRVAMVSPWQ